MRANEVVKVLTSGQGRFRGTKFSPEVVHQVKILLAADPSLQISSVVLEDCWFEKNALQELMEIFAAHAEMSELAFSYNGDPRDVFPIILKTLPQKSLDSLRLRSHSFEMFNNDAMGEPEQQHLLQISRKKFNLAITDHDRHLADYVWGIARNVQVSPQTDCIGMGAHLNSRTVLEPFLRALRGTNVLSSLELIFSDNVTRLSDWTDLLNNANRMGKLILLTSRPTIAMDSTAPERRAFSHALATNKHLKMLSLGFATRNTEILQEAVFPALHCNHTLKSFGFVAEESITRCFVRHHLCRLQKATVVWHSSLAEELKKALQSNEFLLEVDFCGRPQTCSSEWDEVALLLQRNRETDRARQFVAKERTLLEVVSALGRFSTIPPQASVTASYVVVREALVPRLLEILH